MDAQNDRDHQEEGGILLSMEGQKMLSILESKSEFHSFVNGKINEALNSIADEFLSKVRTSIQDLFFHFDVEVAAEEEEAKTIVDNDWHKVERQYSAMIRFFPDVLSDKRHDLYPIQWMAMRTKYPHNYNLTNVSLIPLLAELGIELNQFDEELRGGLLSTYTNGTKVLEMIIRYERKEEKNNELLDECFLGVRNRLRKNNNMKKEDIQQYNLVGELCVVINGYFSEKRFRYFVDWDPMPVSMPCEPEHGNMLLFIGLGLEKIWKNSILF
jgi:hypothetical protein